MPAVPQIALPSVQQRVRFWQFRTLALSLPAQPGRFSLPQAMCCWKSAISTLLNLSRWNCGIINLSLQATPQQHPQHRQHPQSQHLPQSPQHRQYPQSQYPQSQHPQSQHLPQHLPKSQYLLQSRQQRQNQHPHPQHNLQKQSRHLLRRRAGAVIMEYG